MDGHYISLDALAARLGLPRPFLREQARRGAIPHLCIGRRMRFEEAAVRDVLRQQAARLPKADAEKEGDVTSNAAMIAPVLSDILPSTKEVARG